LREEVLQQRKSLAVWERSYRSGAKGSGISAMRGRGSTKGLFYRVKGEGSLRSPLNGGLLERGLAKTGGIDKE